MPGAVLEVLVSEGDRVERNQTVALMESMKMELVITAPRAGVVRRVSVEPGQQVDRGMRLLELGPEGSGGDGGRHPLCQLTASTHRGARNSGVRMPLPLRRRPLDSPLSHCCESYDGSGKRTRGQLT